MNIAWLLTLYALVGFSVLAGMLRLYPPNKGADMEAAAVLGPLVVALWPLVVLYRVWAWVFERFAAAVRK